MDKILNKCQHCGKPIKWNKFVSKKRYSNIKFCSSKCYFKSRVKLNKCKFCNKKIKTTHKQDKQFCNINCVRSFQEQNKTACNHCAKQCETDTPLQFGRKLFCSHRCFIKHMGIKLVQSCSKCGNPIYSKTGNLKDYKLMTRHQNCEIYKGFI